MADKYLKLDTATGRPTQQTAVDSSAGVGDAGKIPALDSTGRFSTTMMPVGVSIETKTCTVVGGVTAGDWVQIYDNAGNRSCRKALAVDTTKPADGYVLDTVSDGGTVDVYFDGTNTKVAVGTFVDADVGKRVFLSTGTSGGTTKTPPNSSGNLVQKLGKITAVGVTYIEVSVDFGDEIVA